MKVGGVIIGIIGVLRLLAILQGVLIVLAASMVLAIGLQPAIGWFQRHNTPRVVAVGAILLSGLAVAAAAAFLIIPIVVEQVTTLVQTLPDYIDGLAQDSPIIANITQRIDPLNNAGAAMGQLPKGALSAVGTAFKTLFDLLLVLTLTPYFALSLPKAKRWVVRLLARGDREEALHLLNRSTSLMANYIAGNLLVSVIAGTITFVGLRIIGVPYAAALAVFVALTDLIPAVGAASRRYVPRMPTRNVPAALDGVLRDYAANHCREPPPQPEPTSADNAVDHRSDQDGANQDHRDHRRPQLAYDRVYHRGGRQCHHHIGRPVSRSDGQPRRDVAVQGFAQHDAIFGKHHITGIHPKGQIAGRDRLALGSKHQILAATRIA
ncbi:MAG: AI-2E family transporter [Euzebya sp.]